MPITVEQLKQFPDCNVFVETGTGNGDGMGAASESGIFSGMHSIEIDEARYDNCPVYSGGRRIRWHGDSRDILPKLAKGIHKSMKIVFWLDAHDETGTTVFDELRIINELRQGCNDIILIDDIRYFGTIWPALEKLEAAVKAMGKEISYIDGYIKNDIMVCK